MQRLLTAATLVALLVATAAAFAITERLKLTKSALTQGTKISKVFSPTCGCSRSHANIRVVLRRKDTVDAEIVDLHGRTVATLATGESLRRGPLRLRWDGTTDGGGRAPDGTYQVKVHFASQRQTIVVPNKIVLDTHPPEIVNVVANREEFSPDGDKQADFVRLKYTLSKPARLTAFIGDTRVLKTYRHPQRGATTWGGIESNRLLPPGTYTLEIGALDQAGNSTPPADRWRVRVRIRYIELAASRIAARAGKRFSIGVSTDAVRYSWTLGQRQGVGHGGVLTVRAPRKAGLYTLTVSERGHVSRAHVAVK